MREITSHQVNECNKELSISVLDEPVSGGANHKYLISGGKYANCAIEFQNGPIKESGVNGVTQEALLAIVSDRLQSFQKGPFACRENALALTKIEEAIHWLNHRTNARLSRGVEGTHKV